MPWTSAPITGVTGWMSSRAGVCVVMASPHKSDWIGQILGGGGPECQGFPPITPHCRRSPAVGRREEWEDSPDGWPQHPTHSVLRTDDHGAFRGPRDGGRPPPQGTRPE